MKPKIYCINSGAEVVEVMQAATGKEADAFAATCSIMAKTKEVIFYTVTIK